MAPKSSSKKKKRRSTSTSGQDESSGGSGGGGGDVRVSKKKVPKSLSPLNSSVIPSPAAADVSDENNNDRRISTGGDHKRNNTSNDKSGKKKSKHREMSQSKLSEEAALTARLFGGGGDDVTSSGGGAWMDDDDDDDFVESNNRQDEEEEDNGDNTDLLFAIDRSGEEVTNVTDDYEEDEEEDHKQESSDDYHQASGVTHSESEGEESIEEDEEEKKVSMIGGAWQDDDSSDSDEEEQSEDEEGSETESYTNKEQKGVSLVDGPNRLKKLRRYRDETDPISIKEYELRLRERYVNTASVAARTDWADVGLAQKFEQDRGHEEEDGEPSKKRKKKGGYIGSSDEERSDDEIEDVATKLLQSNASLFTSKSKTLPPTLLDVIRTRDANLSDPNNSVVNAVQFHKGSDEETPLLMTAGMDKMLRFFRIDGDSSGTKEIGKGENHTKVHGIHFPKLPITTASFLGKSGSSVVVSGRRPFFYVYDAVSGAVQKTTASQLGRKERSLEKFTTSSDGRTIAFVGNDGYVILVDGKSRQWMGDLKMNGSVRAVTFSECGEYVLGSGSDGDVYRWHIGSRRCVERFHNEDGTITSSLAISNNFLAVGAESGVVNLYNDAYRAQSSTSRGGSSIGLSVIAERNPLKSIMNLTTSADSLQFNHDGNILAISTQRETNGLKLLHVPTATVFSNWPTSKTPLKYVWSTDFSPGSRYLAVGNDHGKCLLYRLKHYWDE